MSKIRIHEVYEEAEYGEPAGWTVEDEDKRIYQAGRFGMQGDAWATVVTAHLAEHPGAPSILERLSFLRFGELRMIGVRLQLRVCSSSFEEQDGRFLYEGIHLAMVQDAFDLEAVRAYMNEVVQKTANRSFRSQYEAWRQHFHLFDLDDD